LEWTGRGAWAVADRVTTKFGDDGANLFGIGFGFQPTLGTGPVHQRLAGQYDCRRVVWQRQTPQCPRIGKEGQPLLAQIAPVDGPQLLASDTLTRRVDRTLAAFQAQVQRLPVMAGGADWHRLLAPFGELEQRAFQIQFQAQAGAQAWFGQYLQ